MSPWVFNASPAVNELSQWPEILGVCLSLSFLMTAIVMLRFYVRFYMIRSVGIDDYVILFSAVS